eukprot:TRINITY_DN1612_c0_g1_i1.p1 TRINITY_DN1612_c0_g1~~TRINITY_DN1612_c0_g1_i1.p1  ORF type:complete len:995 (-),score=303.78 TRINITY_DN1612_c0_g1_i1:91-3075(-)
MRNLMKALKELNDFKIKAQETIRGLKLKLRESDMALEKSTKAHSKEVDSFEQEREKWRKESENQQSKNMKQWEKEKQELEEQLTTISDNLEMEILDREIAEEKCETLELEMEQLRGRLSLMEEETSIKQSISGSSEDVQTLLDQNERLKEALMKLRDMSVGEKQEKEKKIKELERENKKISILQEKLEKVQQEHNIATKEMDEMKEALEAATEGERMIEQLTEKNLNYEDQISELEATVAELDMLREMSEELEENQAAIEKQLRSELYAREVENLDLQGTISNLRNKMADYDRILSQFRVLVKSQTEQLALIKQKETQAAREATQALDKSAQLQNVNMALELKVLKAASIQIEQQLALLNSKQAQLHFAFMKDYLPTTNFQADLQSFSLSLLLDRLQFKIKLIIQNIQHYQIDSEQNQQQYSEDELLYYIELRHLLQNIYWAAWDAQYALSHVESDDYLNFGKLHFDLNPHERIFNHLLTLLKEEELNTRYSTTELEEFFTKFKEIINPFLSDDILPEYSSLQKTIDIIHHQFNLILLLSKRLTNQADRQYLLEDSLVLKALPTKKIVHCLEITRKLIKNFATHEPCADDLESVATNLNWVKDIVSRAHAAFNKFCTEILEQLPESSSFDSVANQVFSDRVDSDWKWLDDLISPVYNTLSDIVNKMYSGVPTDANSTFQFGYTERAQIVKDQLSQASTLKTQLTEKEAEIIEYRKQVQTKDNEIRDEKWKQQALDKKLQRAAKNEEKLTLQLQEESLKHQQQEKMYEEAMDSIQKTNDTFRQENKNLKEKIQKLEAQQAQLKEKSEEFSIPSELVSKEMSSLNQALEFLRREVSILKGKENLFLLETKLPALPITTNERGRQTSTRNEVHKCNKEMNNLLREVQLNRASPKIVDLTSTKPALEQLQSHKIELELLQKRSKDLKNKARSSVMALSNDSNRSGTFSNFPTAAVVQSLQTINPTALGKVSFPSNTAHHTKVTLNTTQFHNLHTLLVQ